MLDADLELFMNKLTSKEMDIKDSTCPAKRDLWKPTAARTRQCVQLLKSTVQVTI